MAKNYHHFFQGFISVMICLLVIQVGLMVFADMAKAEPEIQKTDSLTIWTKKECEAEVKKIAQNNGYTLTSEQIKDSFKSGKCFQPSMPVNTSGGITYDASQGIGGYIVGLYKYAVGIGGILAVVVMMVGGLLWMTAGGSSERVTQGRNYIFGALTGLILLLCAYLILNTVNTRLVNFGALEIPMIKGEKLAKFGCNWVKEKQCPTTPTPKYPPTDSGDCGPDTTGGTGVCCCFRCIKQGDNCTFDDECCQEGDPSPDNGQPWSGPNHVCHTYFTRNQCQPPSELNGGCKRLEECATGLICDTAGIGLPGSVGGNNCIKPNTLINWQSCNQSSVCQSDCCCDISWGRGSFQGAGTLLGGDDVCTPPDDCIKGGTLYSISLKNIISGGINLGNETGGCKIP